jgi:hypothetical protein
MSDGRIDRARGWKIQIALIVFVIYTYVLLEWLFFATKPSFLDKLDLFDKIEVLLVAPIPLVLGGTVVLFLCFLPYIVTRNISIYRISSISATAVTTLILVAASFLLIDNFTYTVLRFGVRNMHGAELAAYWFLLVVLAILLYYETRDINRLLFRKFSFHAIIACTMGIIVVSVAFAAVNADISSLKNINWNKKTIHLDNPPNIIILSCDGLNAEHLSVYGYKRKTTPFLDDISQNLLLCENCFVNADASSGSIASMFTGKLPTQTGVFYPPQILEGDDAYQHLPGILREHGYRNTDISTRYHADPIDMNMLNSFHRANGRNMEKDKFKVISLALLGEKAVYFIGQMRDRITLRFLHVINAQHMRDPLSEVGGRSKGFNRDSERIKELFAIIDKSSSPFFVHVHLLGTHGPKFQLNKRVFSKNKVETDPWMTDFYDDSILDLDSIIERLMKKLRGRKIADKTVVVICTDHGQRWTVDVRVPLMFIFPNGEHRRRLTANIQNLDIAPTVLDYVGIAQPQWMGGVSLLSSKVEDRNYIFTTTRESGLITKKGIGSRKLDAHKVKPPFYSLGSVGVFYHQKLYKLLLKKCVLTISDIEGHTAPCGEEELPDPQEIGRMIIDHLKENGYDTSSIKAPLTIEIIGPPSN